MIHQTTSLLYLNLQVQGNHQEALKTLTIMKQEQSHQLHHQALSMDQNIQ